MPHSLLTAGRAGVETQDRAGNPLQKPGEGAGNPEVHLREGDGEAALQTQGRDGPEGEGPLMQIIKDGRRKSREYKETPGEKNWSQAGYRTQDLLIASQMLLPTEQRSSRKLYVATKPASSTCQ